MKYDFSRLGENIASLRRAAGLTQELLADRLGVFFADAGSWNIELAYDGVHFSESGHRTFSAELKRTLETLHI